MKIALLILCTFLPVFSCLASSNDDATSDYAREVNREEPGTGDVMLDVIKVKKEICGMDLGIKDIRLIAQKDSVFEDLAKGVSSDHNYLHSTDYQKKLTEYFGKC